MIESSIPSLLDLGPVYLVCLYLVIGAAVFLRIAESVDRHLGLGTEQFRIINAFSNKNIMLRIYAIYGLIVVLWPVVAGALGAAWLFLAYQDYVS